MWEKCEVLIKTWFKDTGSTCKPQMKSTRDRCRYIPYREIICTKTIFCEKNDLIINFKKPKKDFCHPVYNSPKSRCILCWAWGQWLHSQYRGRWSWLHSYQRNHRILCILRILWYVKGDEKEALASACAAQRSSNEASLRFGYSRSNLCPLIEKVRWTTNANYSALAVINYRYS